MNDEEYQQPKMDCPNCGKVYDDFDGLGVVYCDPAIGGCGFCRHLASTGSEDGWVCDFCGHVDGG